MRLWAIRITALTALLIVGVLYGPRAYAVMDARIHGPAPLVDLDRVGLTATPTWLRSDPALARSALVELAPVLAREVRQDDAAAQEAVVQALRALSWVKSAAFRPAHPDQLELALELHRPVLQVEAVGPIAGKVQTVLVSAEGRCMRLEPSAGDSALPRCRLIDGPLPGTLPVYQLGEEHPDPRVLAAAATAVEWRDAVAPVVEAAPELLEVDASNLGYRLVSDRRFAEVQVVMARRGGGQVVLGYGRAPGHPLPRVDVADKVAVLRKILKRYPGLDGLDKGDLRFVNLWENWLRPRPTKQPGADARTTAPG